MIIKYNFVDFSILFWFLHYYDQIDIDTNLD